MYLVLWFYSEPTLVLGVPASWSLGGLPAMSMTLRLGVERRRQALCGGRGDPLPWWRSSLVEPGIKVTVDLVFSEET